MYIFYSLFIRKSRAISLRSGHMFFALKTDVVTFGGDLTKAACWSNLLFDKNYIRTWIKESNIYKY